MELDGQMNGLTYRGNTLILCLFYHSSNGGGKNIMTKSTDHNTDERSKKKKIICSWRSYENAKLKDQASHTPSKPETEEAV